MVELNALMQEFDGHKTQVLGVSVDSKYSHRRWAEHLQPGGLRFPLLADFHPKGAVGASFGLYLEDRGICDRATVIIDKKGVVRYAHSVTPAGKREGVALLEEVKNLFRK